MKYYCEQCGTIVIYPNWLKGSPDWFPECPVDKRNMKPLPDYETVEQWEARTGRKLSDQAQVWWRYSGYPWLTGELALAKDRTCQILIGGPEPPPDDWKGGL
jgi:hypothetical protein